MINGKEKKKQKCIYVLSFKLTLVCEILDILFGTTMVI